MQGTRCFSVDGRLWTILYGYGRAARGSNPPLRTNKKVEKTRRKMKTRKQYEREWYQYYCLSSGEKYTKAGFIWYYITIYSKTWIGRKICARFGHKWEDNGSYAGPDTGSDDFICKRCGKEFHHIYY